MIKLILFGSYALFKAWHIDNDSNYIRAGWDVSANELRRLPDSRILLVDGSRPCAGECARGLTINEIEIIGPWSENLARAEKAARFCLHPVGRFS